MRWAARRCLASSFAIVVLSACTVAPPLPTPPAAPVPSPVARPPAAATPARAPAVPSPSTRPQAAAPSPAPRAAAQELALARDGDIWLSRLDGSSALRLTHEGRDSAPEWSADGTRLFFVRDLGAGAEIYSVGADGSGLRRLTNGGLEQRGPRPAPQGGLIAYVRPRDLNGNGLADPSEDLEVWVAREDGSGGRKLAAGFDPAWSPDGLRIAYATNGRRTASGQASPSENALHLVNAQGQNDWELLPLAAIPQDLERGYGFPFRPGSRWLKSPSWAADGQRVGASADGHTGLALSVDEQSRDVRLWVLNYEGGVGRTVFAPRGGRLAVESRPASGFAHVLVVDTANSQNVDLGSEKLSFSAVEPTWAPDGERLAVVTFPGIPEAPSGARELLVFSALDGKVQSRAAAGSVGQPAWNPTR